MILNDTHAPMRLRFYAPYPSLVRALRVLSLTIYLLLIIYFTSSLFNVDIKCLMVKLHASTIYT